MNTKIENTEKIKKTAAQAKLNHIAVIMDGNRRWAKSKLLPVFEGHKKGVEALRTILKSCAKFGIKYLTVYAFSTENWNRAIDEVNFLMDLLAKTIVKELPSFMENNVKLKFIGDRNSLKKELSEILTSAENETKNNNGVNLQIAFNYGARAEIKQAFEKLLLKIENGEIKKDDIKEEDISSCLYTSTIQEPDLLIRTGGEKRISNFLLWQCAYTELYFTDILWPDFDESALTDAILAFSSRNRRYGK